MSREIEKAKWSLPCATAEVTFLTPEQGDRCAPASLTRQYMPHIVMQSPDIRHAKIDDDGIGREHYLGVCFLAAPQDVRCGMPVTVTLGLMYHPRVDYSEVVPGATFTIREGGRVVGYGRVIDRILD